MAGTAACDVLLDLVRSGKSVAEAAAVVGVTPKTGRCWIRRAGGPEGVGLTQGGVGRPWGGRLPQSWRDEFFAGLIRGLNVTAAAAAVGVSHPTGLAWIRDAGGVRPRVANPALEAAITNDEFLGSGPLVFLDRVRIETMSDCGYPPAQIATIMGRPRSTIHRELAKGRRRPGSRYRAMRAQTVVDANRSRAGRPTKLVPGSALFDEVVARLKSKHSPEQIARRLRKDFPDNEEMWVSHETIYQALYVQPKGELVKAVGNALRTGRTRRKPHGRAKQPTMRGMVNISERPAEADDRAVAGHWEGDLIVGAASRSAIGTLVERTTGFTMLLHLPDDHTALTVSTAMQAAIARLPEHLWRSLAWDQGSEMALHTKISTATGLPIYFCDPHSPWQRGTNENTNGLLRQYFPKGTDLSVHGPGILDLIAAELNARPRKRLDWDTPAEALNRLLSNPNETVASTA